tara:strand:+ start:214 stop:534 length:321 start_codon:yes stop_codon:yes gene_type:complete
MKLYRIESTFSSFGTKKDTIKWLDKENVSFINSDYVGTQDEFHSGEFTEYFGVDNGETLEDVLNDYLYHNQDIINHPSGECFNVLDNNNNLIYTEENSNRSKNDEI